MACSSSGNHHHFDILTIEKSESLFKGAASFLFADLTANQLFLLILVSYLGNEKSKTNHTINEFFFHLRLDNMWRPGKGQFP